MTHLARTTRATALGVLILAPVQSARAQADTEVLTNATIVQMVTGKLSRDLITGKINAARPGFDLSSDGIISLNTSKVDQNIIKLMLQVAESAKRRGTAPSTLVGMDEVLNNETIVRMQNSKVPKQLILQKIQMSRSAFDVSASGMVSLKASKVPDDVIKAMMLPPPPAPVAPANIPVREAPSATPTPALGTKPATTATPAKTPDKAAPAKTPAKTPPPPAKKPAA